MPPFRRPVLGAAAQPPLAQQAPDVCETGHMWPLSADLLVPAMILGTKPATCGR